MLVTFPAYGFTWSRATGAPGEKTGEVWVSKPAVWYAQQGLVLGWKVVFSVQVSTEKEERKKKKKGEQEKRKLNRRGLGEEWKLTSRKKRGEVIVPGAPEKIRGFVPFIAKRWTLSRLRRIQRRSTSDGSDSRLMAEQPGSIGSALSWSRRRSREVVQRGIGEVAGTMMTMPSPYDPCGLRAG